MRKLIKKSLFNEGVLLEFETDDAFIVEGINISINKESLAHKTQKEVLDEIIKMLPKLSN